MLEIEIIHEDEDILIVNKPAGLVVNRAASVSAPTLQDWLAQQIQLSGDLTKWQELVPNGFDSSYGQPKEIFQQRLGLVHRLDKDTSGVLLVAKNPGALINLLGQFKQRQVEKQYLCLVHGKLRVPKGVIRAPLDRARVDRQKFAVSPQGRAAVTKYELQQFYAGFNQRGQAKLSTVKNKLSLYQGFSLLACWPQTGRTHQIRVHLKHWHHPLVGDKKYTGKKRAKLDRRWCPRQFLHAAQIKFTHPRSGKKVTFDSLLAADLKQALNLLSPAR